jgi:hypothetical protein
MPEPSSLIRTIDDLPNNNNVEVIYVTGNCPSASPDVAKNPGQTCSQVMSHPAPSLLRYQPLPPTNNIILMLIMFSCHGII